VFYASTGAVIRAIHNCSTNTNNNHGNNNKGLCFVFIAAVYVTPGRRGDRAGAAEAQTVLLLLHQLKLSFSFSLV